MKYFIGVISILLLIFFGYEIFRGVTKKPATPKAPASQALSTKPLHEWASTGASVSVTTQGPVYGNELYHEIRMTVSRRERTIDIIEGYQGLVIETKSYPNNQDAYDIFLRALEVSGFGKEQKPTATDELSTCNQGYHYVYELKNTSSAQDDKRTWSVTCGVTLGSAAGNGPNIRLLFQQQIPDYGTIAPKANLQPLPVQKSNNPFQL